DRRSDRPSDKDRFHRMQRLAEQFARHDQRSAGQQNAGRRRQIVELGRTAAYQNFPSGEQDQDGYKAWYIEFRSAHRRPPIHGPPRGYPTDAAETLVTGAWLSGHA